MTIEKIKRLREERGRLVAEMRAILDGGDLNADAEEKYDRLDAAQADVAKKIEAEERLAKIEADLAQIDEPIERQPISAQTPVPADPLSSDQYAEAFSLYLRRGANEMPSDILAELSRSPDSKGGYVVPTEIYEQMAKEITRNSLIRQNSRVIKINTDKTIPQFYDGEAGWIAEGAAYPAADPSFDSGDYRPKKCGGIIILTEELLADNVVNLEQEIVASLGRMIGLAEELEFAWGMDGPVPRGVMEGQSGNVTTASKTAITGDEVIEAFYSLKPQYRSRSHALISDSALKLLRKLKDSTGQYLWQPALSSGTPDTLLGRPVIEVPDKPGTTAIAGTTAITFGDLSYYVIADRPQMTSIIRLNELYAANGKVGFRGHHRTDADVTIEDSMRRLVMKS